MNILDESYFPYTCVDHREIPLTIILYLCSRSNSDNLGFYPWKFSLCRPANTYQIISSEATKTEIQHIKGTKWGCHRATMMSSVHGSPHCQQLQTMYNYKAINKVSREQKSFYHKIGMSTHNSRSP